MTRSTAPRLLGARVKRLEDSRLLAGGGRFLDDLTLPGLVHAAFVRSAFAHAELHGVDATAARREPGVLDVLTGRDLDGQVEPLAPRLDAPGFTSTAWPVLPVSRLRFAGEPVAVVAAGTPYECADATLLITVDAEPLSTVPDVPSALASGAAVLHPAHQDNVLFRRRHRHGDLEAAFETAALVVRETFTHA